jgi:branched-chain amino acid transport system substrate-binding protein
VAGATAIAGCSGQSGGGGTGPVKVGVLAPLNATQFGKGMENSAKLAADWINENDKILDRDLEVVVGNTELDPTTSVQAAQKLVQQDDVDFLVGNWLSENMLAVQDWAVDNDVIYLSSGATSPKTTENVSNNYEKYKSYFRAGALNSTFLARSEVRFAEEYLKPELGWDSTALFMEDLEWTRALQRVYENQLPEVGIEIENSVRFSIDTNDYSPIFQQVEEAGVPYATTGIGVTGLTPTIQWADSQAPFMLSGVSSQGSGPTFWEQTEGKCEHTSAHALSALPNLRTTSVTVRFNEDYVAEYGDTEVSYPPYVGPVTYDALLVYQDAANRAGSLDNEELIPAIEETSIRGTQGLIEFYPRDHQYAHDLVFGKDNVILPAAQWQEEELEIIWPDDVQTAELKMPSWLG